MGLPTRVNFAEGGASYTQTGFLSIWGEGRPSDPHMLFFVRGGPEAHIHRTFVKIFGIGGLVSSFSTREGEHVTWGVAHVRSKRLR